MRARNLYWRAVVGIGMALLEALAVVCTLDKLPLKLWRYGRRYFAQWRGRHSETPMSKFVSSFCFIALAHWLLAEGRRILEHDKYKLSRNCVSRDEKSAAPSRW